MSASKKILARQSEKRKRHSSSNRSAEAVNLLAENAELKREILFHKEEAIKLWAQLTFWRAECEGGAELTEEDVWRRRYAARHVEAQKFEGLMALRDSEIVELKKQLADKNAQIKNLQKQLFDSTTEQGPVENPGGTSPSDAP